MSYHGALQGKLLGLGAPSWCPPSTFNRDNPQRDPCEIGYKVDLPLLGETVIKMPVNQLINDIRVQLDRELPGIVDNVWTQAQPKLEQLVVGIEDDMKYFVPVLVDEVLREQVSPMLEGELGVFLAQTNLIKEDALKALLLLTATTLLGVGLAAWWIKKG